MLDEDDVTVAYADLEPELTEAGFLALPINGNGARSKSPLVPWRDYQDRWPTPEERHSTRWCERPGAWVLCGTQSRNLAAFDLEDKIIERAQQFTEALEVAGLLEQWQMLHSLCRSRTPSGGLHVYVTLDLADSEEMPGGEPLSRTTTGDLIAETRADRQGIVAPGTDGSVHASGRPWEWEAGNWSTVPTVSLDQYNALCDVLRALDENPAPESPAIAPTPRTPARDGNITPLDAYDYTHTGAEVLEQYGFHSPEIDRDGNQHYTRPGKDAEEGSSATVYADEGTTTLFSTSIDVPAEFTTGRRKLCPSQLYAAFEHQGDFARAASTLAAEGYGAVDQSWANEPDPQPEVGEWEAHARNVADLPDTYEKRPELVAGLMRPGDLVGIGAGRGIGKSWLLYQLAEVLSRGEGQFLDMDVACEPRRVLLIHGELGPDDSHERWVDRSGGAELPVVLEVFEPWQVRVETLSTTIRLDNGITERRDHQQATINPLLAQALGDVDVVIIDPWKAVYNGQENSNDAVNEALIALWAHVIEGTTIVFSHHFGKAQDNTTGDPIDLWRGASVLGDRSHVRITLTRRFKTQKAAEDAGLTDISTFKRYSRIDFLRRNGITPDGFDIRLDSDLQWRPITIEPTERPGSLATVIAALRTHGEADSKQQVADWVGVARTNPTLGESLEQGIAERAILIRPGAGPATKYRYAEDEAPF